MFDFQGMNVMFSKYIVEVLHTVLAFCSGSLCLFIILLIDSSILFINIVKYQVNYKMRFRWSLKSCLFSEET